MLKNKSILFKFILLISGSSTLIFLSVLGFNYHVSRGMIMKNVEENAQNFTQRTVNRIESVLVAVEKISEQIAFFLEDEKMGEKQIIDMLRLVVENNEELHGVGLGFEPYAFDADRLYFGPYCFKDRKTNRLKFEWIGSEDYRYFYLDWYQIARELDRPCWSEPYFDDVLMTTYSVPFYEYTPEGRNLKGIVSADISLDWLTEIVSSVKVLETGDAYLISKNGTIITHNVKELIMNESIFSVAEARNDPSLREIGRKMIRGETGFVPFRSVARDKMCWMYYAPIPSTGWTLAVLFPQDEFFADIHKHNTVVLTLVLSGSLLLVVVVAFISRSITKPLVTMSKAAAAIGTGNLEVPIPELDTKDEVGKLNEALRYMRTSLKDYVQKLTETTAAKERIESELKIAHEIQISMLPRSFPPFPHRKDFDIYALMEPAKEVGGDFYDFFLIDDKRLCVIIGDVSGKGVPAALFMMITKTLLKNVATENLPPHEILFKVNNILAVDNDACMFATVFCGILDTETGELEFASAGHNPPLLYHGEQGIEFLSVDRGFVLGPMENSRFTTRRTKLNRGSTLFLFTDGVTEAMNPQQEFFFEERLKESLSRSKDLHIKDVVQALRNEINAFAQGEPQSDDITMLILRYFG
jgi:sigma-B regulation protein RsbU (phosphoserine phosphatase)